MRDARRRLATVLALAALAAAGVSSGCAGRPGVEFFPISVDASQGVIVAWRGQFVRMRMAAERERPGAVYVDEGGRWALDFRIIDSVPEAGPFAGRRELTVVMAKPQGFFGVNKVPMGHLVDVRMTVWRGDGGRLRARIERVIPAPNAPR